MRPRSLLLFAAIVLAIIYAGLMVALRPGAFLDGDEGIAWLQVDALWSHAWTSLAVDPPGSDLDPGGDFLPVSLLRPHGPGGSVRSTLPATLPLLASLPFALLGGRGAYLVPAVAAILCMLVTARLARRAFASGSLLGDDVSPWPAVAGTCAVAASPLVVYGATFQEQTLTAVLATAALIPLCKAQTESAAGGAVVSGLFLGLAAAAHPQAALMIPAVVVAGLIAWGWRLFAPRALAVLAGAGSILAARALYHRATFGRLLPPHVLDTLSPGIGIRDAGLLGSKLVQAGDLLLPAATTPLFAAIAILLAAFCLFRPLRGRMLRWVPRPVMAASGPAFGALMLASGPLLTFMIQIGAAATPSTQRGHPSLADTWPLMAMAPVVALSPAPGTSPRLRFLGWTGGLFIALALLCAESTDGPRWGPSSLLPALPCLTVALVGAVAGRRGLEGGRPATAFLWIAICVAVALQGTGMRYLVAARNDNASLLARVRAAVPEGGVILTDLSAVPQLLAPLARGTPALWVPPGSDLEALSARLEERNITPYWIVRSELTREEADHAPAQGAGRGPARADRLDLGGGLSLTRPEQEEGVRGFTDIPRGD